MGPSCGNSGGRGHLAAWISSKKGWPPAQPGVLQGPGEVPREVGTGVDREQRLGKRDVSFLLVLVCSLMN